MSKFIYGKYENEEEEALNCFEKFAEYYPESFREYTPTKYGTYYDVHATSKNGSEEHIELKLRADGSDSYPTCYIEPHKWENLMKSYRREEALPIYINFIGGYNNVYMFQLENIKNAQWHPSVTIHGEDEEQDRIGLDWKDAWHFIYTDGKYNLVNRGK